MILIFQKIFYDHIHFNEYGHKVTANIISKYLKKIMKNLIKNIIFDIDGVLTDGSFLYDEKGKKYKRFGAHDADGLNLLKKYFKLFFYIFRFKRLQNFK